MARADSLSQSPTHRQCLVGPREGREGGGWGRLGETLWCDVFFFTCERNLATWERKVSANLLLDFIQTCLNSESE